MTGPHSRRRSQRLLHRFSIGSQLFAALLMVLLPVGHALEGHAEEHAHAAGTATGHVGDCHHHDAGLHSGHHPGYDAGHDAGANARERAPFHLLADCGCLLCELVQSAPALPAPPAPVLDHPHVNARPPAHYRPHERAEPRRGLRPPNRAPPPLLS